MLAVSGRRTAPRRVGRRVRRCRPSRSRRRQRHGRPRRAARPARANRPMVTHALATVTGIAPPRLVAFWGDVADPIPPSSNSSTGRPNSSMDPSSGSWSPSPSMKVKQGGLPGAVRPDEPEEITLLDRQRDVAHGDRVAVGERHAVEIDNYGHWSRVRPIWSARLALLVRRRRRRSGRPTSR